MTQPFPKLYNFHDISRRQSCDTHFAQHTPAHMHPTVAQMAEESPEVAEAATAVGQDEHDETHSKRERLKGLLYVYQGDEFPEAPR